MSQSGGTLTSGTLSGSSYGTRSFGSEDNTELRARMEMKRKRRKESNRESAKRSRLRKQHHLDELTSQVNQLRTKKQQLVAALALTAQNYAEAEAQNSVLRTQAMELGSRLRALREIICCMNDVVDANAGQLVDPSPAASTAAATYYYPTTAAATTGFEGFGGNPWSSGMQMNMMMMQQQQQQQPVDLLYPVQW